MKRTSSVTHCRCIAGLKLALCIALLRHSVSQTLTKATQCSTQGGGMRECIGKRATAPSRFLLEGRGRYREFRVRTRGHRPRGRHDTPLRPPAQSPRMQMHASPHATRDLHKASAPAAAHSSVYIDLLVARIRDHTPSLKLNRHVPSSHST